MLGLMGNEGLKETGFVRTASLFDAIAAFKASFFFFHVLFDLIGRATTKRSKR